MRQASHGLKSSGLGARARARGRPALIQPLTSAGRCRSPGILPHRRRRPGRARRSARRAFPARSCRVVAEAQRRAPIAGRALEERAAGTSGRQRAHRRQLGEQVEILDAGQAVGADRDAHARRIERARPAARRRPTQRLLRGQVTSVAPAAASSRELAVGELHAVDGEQPLATGARSRRGTRPAAAPAAATPDSRHPSASSNARHGPAAVGRNSTSSGDSPRWTLVMASLHRRPANRQEQRRRHRVRRVRSEARCGRQARSALTAAIRRRAAADALRVGVVHPEAQQLVKHVRRHAGVVQQRAGHERVADVADQRGAAARPRRWPASIASMSRRRGRDPDAAAAAPSAPRTQRAKRGGRRHPSRR